MNDSLTRISTWLPKADAAALKAAAQEERQTVAALIRRLIVDYLRSRQ